MIPECEHYVASLKAIHAGLERTVAGLETRELDAVPVAGANSLAVIISHSMGSERYLIIQLIGGTEIRRDRAAEFTVRGRTEAELTELIRSTFMQCQVVISSLSEEQMGQLRQHREGTRPVRWCILHDIEHLAEHLGHAGLTRQLVTAPNAP